MPAPIPFDAPVTNATFPSSFLIHQSPRCGIGFSFSFLLFLLIISCENLLRLTLLSIWVQRRSPRPIRLWQANNSNRRATDWPEQKLHLLSLANPQKPNLFPRCTDHRPAAWFRGPAPG